MSWTSWWSPTAGGNEIDLDARSATRFTFTMPGGKVTVEASFVREGGQTQDPPDHLCRRARLRLVL